MIRKSRKFWGTLPAGVLAKSIPFWNTWDDHDFGRNDSDGRVIGKENIRQASALANYGEQGEGIYTKFRHGPVEVWMIDGRWFSQTNPSWADPDRPNKLNGICTIKKELAINWLNRRKTIGKLCSVMHYLHLLSHSDVWRHSRQPTSRLLKD